MRPVPRLSLSIVVAFACVALPAPAPALTAASTSPASAAVATRVCDVIAYGADPSGTRDSEAAIQRAIDDCSTRASGEVVLPAGTFSLRNGENLAVRGPFGPIIAGAGAASTSLVQHGATGVFGITAGGTVIEDLDLNTATFNAGAPLPGSEPAPPVIYAAASNVTIEDVRAEAGAGFGIRLVGPQPCSSDLLGHNVVRNVTIANRGVGGFASLDVSCQDGSQISGVDLTGGILALYRDRNVSLSNEVYQPGPLNRRCAAPWFVTGPAEHITITRVLSRGGAGVIHGPATGITVAAQRVTTAGC